MGWSAVISCKSFRNKSMYGKHCLCEKTKKPKTKHFFACFSPSSAVNRLIWLALMCLMWPMGCHILITIYSWTSKILLSYLHRGEQSLFIQAYILSQSLFLLSRVTIIAAVCAFTQSLRFWHVLHEKKWLIWIWQSFWEHDFPKSTRNAWQHIKCFQETHPIHDILQKRTKHKIRTNRLQNWSSDTREGEAEEEWCAHLSEHAEGCVLNTKQCVLTLSLLPQPMHLIQVLGLYYT